MEAFLSFVTGAALGVAFVLIVDAVFEWWGEMSINLVGAIMAEMTSAERDEFLKSIYCGRVEFEEGQYDD